MHNFKHKALSIFVLGIGLAGSAVQAADPFTIVALPDTQNYVNSSSNAPLFTAQTQWISDQVLVAGNPRNIIFVTHLGDVVSSGSNITQWNRADTSMGIIDDVIAYGILPGNHDFNSTGVKSTSAANFVTYFGPTRFASQGWYGGADPSGLNSYQAFSGGGYDFIHLSLEWRPAENVPVRSPSPIEWAQSVLDANPDTPFILSSHEHLDDSPTGRTGAGQSIWDLLVRQNDQIFMILAGHNHGAGGMNDGEYHQVSYNDAGRVVFEVLQDFQDYPNGGDGWLRLIQFDIDNDKIHFETYSPVLDQFQTETVAQVGGFASLFEFDIDFADRLNPIAIEPPPSPFGSLTFQHGVNGYAGAEDKEIRSSGGDENNGQDMSISVDGDDGPGTAPNHGLLQFADIIGVDADQIPAGATIESATLALNVTNPGSGIEVYTMLQTWDESTTWVDLGGDGVTPGVESDSNPIESVGGNNGLENVPTGILTLDITAAVQAWTDGQSNHGVALLPFPSGTNGIDFDTSEGNITPLLTVKLLLPGIFVGDFQQGASGYTGTVDTQIRQAAATSNYATASSVSVDAADPSGNQNHILIRFENIFGLNPDQIPASSGTRIVRADLRINATNPGDGADLHRLLQSWSDTDTWAGSFGGNGVQADDLEAVAAPDATIAGSTGLVTIDVTKSIEAWLGNPSTNLGWVLLPRGGDGWDFDTAEGGIAPQLVVYYEFIGDCNDDGMVDILDERDMEACLLGPGVGLGLQCDCFDLDSDGDVTVRDYAVLQLIAGS